jgi:hypothetical protein
MGFLSVIKAIGHGLHIGVDYAAKVQSTVGAQMIESAFLPAPVVKLISAGVSSVSGAEAIANQAAHTSTLTGAQKMAVALAAFDQAYQDYAQQAGLPAEPGKAQAILQGVYDLLIKVPTALPEPAPAPPAA